MESGISGVGILFALVVVAAAAWFSIGQIYGYWKRSRITVDDTQFGLLIENGELTKQLDSGVFSTWFSDNRIEIYDRREQSLTLGGQEMLTADNLTVKVSVILAYMIKDAATFRRTSALAENRLYEIVQVLLRERVATNKMEALLENRLLVTEGASEALAKRFEDYGVQIVSLELRDFTLAGAAKQAYADLWKAQKDGEIALTRARGEQAALRSLANSARMLKGNPALMNLRLLQALEGSGGKGAPTLVLGTGPGGLTQIEESEDSDVSSNE